jgi:hypothetical protein
VPCTIDRAGVAGRVWTCLLRFSGVISS